MIDEQSSASGQDYASDRSAIGAGYRRTSGLDDSNMCFAICLSLSSRLSVFANAHHYLGNNVCTTTTAFTALNSAVFKPLT